MSRDYSTFKNKHPKVPFKQYLLNYMEPIDNIIDDTPVSIESELFENSHHMRKKFRYIARDIRNS